MLIPPDFTNPPVWLSQTIKRDEMPPYDWGNLLVGVPAVHKFTKGAGIKIGIADTGIDMNHPSFFDHPSFAGAIANAQDFTGSPVGVLDRQGHGTHVAGTIGARGDVYKGVAPESRLYIAKVLGDNGNGGSQGIAAGIRWLVQQGVDVINMSLGSPVADQSIQAAISEAVRAGVVIICAAGNDGRRNSVNWPAKSENVIAISAVGHDGTIADYSSFGPEVDFAAPGSEITSCAIGGGFATLSGTSMASPLVTGLVALGMAYEKTFVKPRTIMQVVSRLKEYTIDAGAPGRDPIYGEGVISCKRLESLPLLPPPPTAPISSGAVEQIVRDGVPGLWIPGAVLGR